MTVLSNIAHSGNPETPRNIPDWISVGPSQTWKEFEVTNPVKNEIYVENFENGQKVELRNEAPQERRLNNFAIFNDLIDDLEADRKAHCKVREFINVPLISNICGRNKTTLEF